MPDNFMTAAWDTYLLFTAGAVKTKEPDRSGDGGVRASPVLQYWGTLEDRLRRGSKASTGCCQGEGNADEK